MGSVIEVRDVGFHGVAVVELRWNEPQPGRRVHLKCGPVVYYFLGHCDKKEMPRLGLKKFFFK